ncbi:MAG: phosphotransferase [Ilumatobacteraceae bacterium]
MTEVPGAGTVNAIFRIGDGVAARFPVRRADPARVREDLRSEMTAAAEFAELCPFPAPFPQYLGHSGHGYPLAWMTQSWVPGRTATPTSDAHSSALADDLALLIGRLRDHDPAGRSFAGTGRGGVLSDHDAWVTRCIERSEGLADTTAMRSMWSRFRVLPRDEPDAMCHSDLIPSNLLVARGRLVGVLDAGGFRAADPALDLVVAWHLFDAAPRARLRDALGCTELQWERGKAWAFQQAAGLEWYYRESNPAMAELGRTTLHRLMADDQR